VSEYEALRKDIEEVGAAMARYAGAVNHHADAVQVTFDQLWADNAELRDELHALANRVETLTRARLTEPAEVAERMVFVCRLNRGCNVSRPHIHADDGAVIYVEDEATADDQLRQRAHLERVKQRAKMERRA
jgi:hypothetical protein